MKTIITIKKRQIQDLDKIIDEKRNEISSIKEITKEELNQSYLNNVI